VTSFHFLTLVCVCSLWKAGIEAEELCNMHMYKFVFDPMINDKSSGDRSALTKTQNV
jgi:hypothetical protein